MAKNFKDKVNPSKEIAGDTLVKDPSELVDEAAQAVRKVQKSSKMTGLSFNATPATVSAQRISNESGSSVAVGAFAGGTEFQFQDAGDVSTGGISGSRSTDRQGRKRDYPISIINSVVSEQAAADFLEEKQIQEGGKQGYRGRNKQIMGRFRKNGGNTTRDMDFHRSLDILGSNAKVVSINGQYHAGADKYNSTVEGAQIYPLYTYNEGTQAYELHNIANFKRGNKIWKRLKLSMAAGKLSASVELEDATPSYSNGKVTYMSAETFDESCLLTEPLFNEAQIARLHMKDVAGNESKENWSPLASAIAEPEPTLRLMSDLEISAGSHIAAHVQAVHFAMSMQYNLMVKEGNNTQIPMRRLLTGITDYSALEALTNDNAWLPKDGDNFIRTSGMLLLKDTKNKYNTKGDLLVGKNFKRYFESSSKLYQSFVIRPEFKKALDYATAAGFEFPDYQPSAPLLRTKHIYLEDILDPNLVVSLVNDVIVRPVTYAYDDDKNGYIVPQSHDLLDGIYRYIVKNKARLIEKLGLLDGNDYYFDLRLDYENPTAFGLLLLDAMSDISQSRDLTKVDIIDYADNSGDGYPFTWAKPLSEFNPLKHKYIGFEQWNRPLMFRQLPDEVMLNFKVPEIMKMVAEDAIGDENYFLHNILYAPDTFSKSGDEYTNEKVQNHPSFRMEVHHHIAELFERLGSSKVRNLMDVPTLFVGFQRNVAAADVLPYSHGNLGANIVVKMNTPLTGKDVLSAPRRYGWIKPMPNGVDSKVASWAAVNPTGYGGFEVRCYTPAGGVNPITGRGLAYSQKWYEITSEAKVSDVVTFFTNTGIMLSLEAQALSTFNPGIPGEITALRTNSDYYYTAFNRFLWGINPFDGVIDEGASDEDAIYSPYELLYVLGFTGFRLSDYTEVIDTEIEIREAQQIKYTTVQMMKEDNPIFE